MDFEVKHLICAGLDVHKKTIVAAVCMTDPSRRPSGLRKTMDLANYA